eukprot:486930-Karenia_brevis.AAC.2
MSWDIDAKERIVGFAPAYAAYLYNRLHRGGDGKVAYESVKGKKPTVVGIEFGEKALYRRAVGAKMEEIKSWWEYGIFVGVNRRSNKFLQADEEGIRR